MAKEDSFELGSENLYKGFAEQDDTDGECQFGRTEKCTYDSNNFPNRDFEKQDQSRDAVWHKTVNKQGKA